jgi:hypothetical protein
MPMPHIAEASFDAASAISQPPAPAAAFR